MDTILKTAPDGKLVTAAEVAEVLSLPISWVRERTRAGDIPAHSFGKYRRYDLAEVRAWAAKQKQDG